jgi:hypothetical protein
MSEISQKSSQNIDIELDTLWIIAYGKMWSWKTTIILELAFENWNKRIYSNFSIYKNWKQINKQVQSAKEIMNIRFSYTPWIILIDEAWINVNSKDWRSQDNRDLIEKLFTARKYNCSFSWISQRFESIDINARVLADLIIKMRKIKRWSHWPLFEVTRQKQIGNNLELVNIHRIDTIALMKYDKLTYNTLETAKFVNKEDWKQLEIKTLRKKSKVEWEEGKILRVDIN